MNKPRILMIHTGGTLGMQQPEGTRLDLGDDEHLKRMIDHVPELAEIADVTLMTPWNLDSSDVGPDHWARLAQLVVEEGGMGSPGGYDGIVIIHGTDTMAYAASMLSLMLRNPDRPVVFTGSQRPLEVRRSDARANLAAAVECATLALPEVAIVFGDSVLRACRTSKIDSRSYNAFGAPSFGTLGQIGTDLNIAWRSVRTSDQPFALKANYDARILALTMFPGIDTSMVARSIYDAAARDRLRAVIIRGFGVGNVPIAALSDLRPLLDEAGGEDLYLIISSQCYRSHTDLSLYPGGRALVARGAIAAGDMTLEAVVTKAMWALGNPEQTLRQWFETDLAGEVSLP